MRDDYRERATRAEQENARLREQLARRPNYEWFVEQVCRQLKQPEGTPPGRLAHQIKQLKMSKGDLVCELNEALAEIERLRGLS